MKKGKGVQYKTGSMEFDVLVAISRHCYNFANKDSIENLKNFERVIRVLSSLKIITRI